MTRLKCSKGPCIALDKDKGVDSFQNLQAYMMKLQKLIKRIETEI